MADLIGYEEKDPAVLSKMVTGYPRFVVHPLVRQLACEFGRRNGLEGHTVWLAASTAIAERLASWLGGDARVVAADGLVAVAFAPDSDRNARAKVFLQHCGGFISSRQAEDALSAAGLLPPAAAEELVREGAEARVKAQLRLASPGAGDADIFLSGSGMNALYAAFSAVEAVQRPRGRTVWIQLGWLYLDTIAILQKFTASPATDHVVVASSTDLAGLRRVLEENSGRVAAILTEVPTNPLIESADVPELVSLARKHGAHLLLDASIASPWNVDLLPYADIALSSLTKYAAAVGDVLAGVAMVNPAGPDAVRLRYELGARVVPPYRRDLWRLAHEIGSLDEVVARVNRSVPEVVAFLESRPEVRRIHWALSACARDNFRKVARNPIAVGSMITFELAPGALAAFYDRVRLPKGPSFGLRNSLLCPFMYLAHYDLVKTAEGRKLLWSHGLNPDLLRFSVGMEPVDEIIGALAEGLDALKTA
jgi:cystathionine gamma-synthase